MSSKVNVRTLVLCSSMLLTANLFAGNPGYLGFQFKLQQESPASQWLHVHAIDPDGPARVAGLQPQDLIVAINSRPVQFKSKLALIEYLATIKAESIVRFTVVRGATRTVITLRPTPMSAAQAQRWQDNYKLAKELDAKKP